MNSQPPAGKRARHQLFPPYSESSTALPIPPFPTHTGSSILIDDYSSSEGSLTTENHASRQTGKKLTNRRYGRRQVISIDMLPNDVLLEIFNFYVDEYQLTKKGIEAWQSLVHVCQRWRNVTFGSPRRLKLQLVCTNKTSTRDMLDVWPPIPLILQSSVTLTEGVDNIVAVLERRDRVYRIDLFQANSSPLKTVLAAMQEPFPELRYLMLLSYDETVPVVPDSFLGGSAPRLEYLELDGISFPGLPKLLFSTTHLVRLLLLNIPHCGYFSPEAFATALSTLTCLEEIQLEFRSPRPHPDLESRRPYPATRSVLPVLTSFWFKGVCEYLDDVMAHIDAPRVNLSITFFNQIVFDLPQFIQFISRTPRLKALEGARVVFGDGAARVSFSSQTSDYESLRMEISCRELDWQVSSLEQVCTLCLPPLSTLEDLYIYEAPYPRPHWQDNIENVLWLELLHPFTAVKKLYLSTEFAPRIVPALQELVGGRTTEVLPALQSIFLEELLSSGPVHEGIQQFVAMRQVTSHPVTVSRWFRSTY